MSRLRSVLSTDDLPLAELCAARIDGEVVRLADGWSPVDEPDTPQQRALAVAVVIDDRAVIERMSAAWVHGAVPLPPLLPQFCVPKHTRIAIRPRALLELREVLLEDEEVIEWPGARCTTPMRTAIDLLRDARLTDDTATGIATSLLANAGETVDAVVERLAGWFRLPGKVHALRRLGLENQS
jgi:hypothetical protein